MQKREQARQGVVDQGSDPECRSERARDKSRIGQRRQIDKANTDPAGPCRLVTQGSGNRDRQRRLADSGRADEGHQTLSCKLLAQLVAILIASDDPVERRRKRGRVPSRRGWDGSGMRFAVRVLDRSDETVAAHRNIDDVALSVTSIAQCLSQARHVHPEVALATKVDGQTLATRSSLLITFPASFTSAHKMSNARLPNATGRRRPGARVGSDAVRSDQIEANAQRLPARHPPRQAQLIALAVDLQVRMSGADLDETYRRLAKRNPRTRYRRGRPRPSLVRQQFNNQRVVARPFLSLRGITSR